MIVLNYWLVKTEPEDYSFADLARAETDTWDGVKNRQAQKNIRSMMPGDLVFIYHTGKERAIIGVGEVASHAFTDPTDAKFSAVSIHARYKLKRPVTLREIKELPEFGDWALVRQSRLSVMPVSEAQWQGVLRLAQS
ncbi:MAG: EVE domain-containing protein [Bacillota bacterium]|nr:EVE domain-containing protein [Bacillota bacterium]MDW7683630.1 EVE domain-containing protein [Bacillota bacterium]